MEKAMARNIGLLGVFAYLLGIIALPVQAQVVDHWESVVLDSDTWRYLVPATEPANWQAPSFDDTSWPEGPGGFGYGDDDDATVLENARSVFTRISFIITDTSAIGAAMLHVDYDDAFVAYLNNVEIARSGIGAPGDLTPFDHFAESLNEAALYQGGTPSYTLLNKEQLAGIVLEGTNLLAVQVHNDNENSSDLTSRTFFSVGLLDTDTQYRPVPDWFIPPRENPDELFSTLPLVVLDTQGQVIPDEPKLIARMGIIDNGEGVINAITDPFTDYDGIVGIERRGSSSQSFPKLSYAIETRGADLEDVDVSLLGLPEEEDWVLNGPYSDKSLMRNVLVYHLANQMGRYAPRTRFVELVLNNEYQGIYVLMEKIKRDKNRVDISKLNPEEVAGDDLTGGYIIKIDKSSGSEVAGWQSPYAPKPGSAHRVFYQYHYPKPSEIVPAQQAYIQSIVATFEDVMASPNFADSVDGYAKYIDVDSAIDFYILNEIARNVDGYRLSTYLHKEKDSEGDGKLIFGPIWDFNLGFGNADYYNGGQIYGFQSVLGVPEFDSLQPPFWWAKLWREPGFNAKVISRWNALRQTTLHADSIMQYIDANVALLGDAPSRNFQQWSILGTYVWPNAFVGNTYTAEIDFFKNWIRDRLDWIDENLASSVSVSPPIPVTLGTFELSNVYPNPIENEGSISLTIGRQQTVRIEIYDLTGRLVLLPFEDVVQVGTPRVITFSSAGLASGAYLVRAVGTDAVTSRKFIVR
ncbi:MAG: CotH kinase family protein [Rhodothermales bacterium]